MKLSRKEKYLFLKCSEELNELAVELLQSVNKPHKNNLGKIFDEIDDVKKYLKQFENIKNFQA